ncbi:MAG TPA: 23S rRNA (pseudouridine(1915)-N(3))-methyltransferase RlmH [Bacteroidales bacterium]|nr:23S rRNA (pseudouridine(1915)-N(3))-methyltransferase RlmH [Bacteroidales bacterium]
MKIKLLMIGKTTDAKLAALIDEYAGRLKYYINFEQTVIPELKNAKNLTFEQQKEREGELLLAKLEKSDEVILLDERGKHYTSIEFSDFISKKMIFSNKSMVFVVGGPYGFSEKVYQRADSQISLSKMTFSHQMIRLFFTEQLYRAMTIIKGEPYHHE